ncbi:GNAT family N-acetyltransferase [Sporosarcina sp. G11-34]|uniref:GNAT family N-acetyltransferase n=1 Tax=Sporosarcina sp. G11-34 TaxID=2849605 RepID=UPI0022A904B0|nr:GNAT family N-acetyltransferase [Sporosarcina sp. G11-34]MCZ2259416.1 GNAT family N-acetyltransferase [Sporosarcina sp. G11-34]
MLIREIKPDDAERLVKLIKLVERESQYMLFESGERNTGPEQQRKRIEVMKEEGNSTIFVAEENDELVGYLFAMGGNAKRNKHSVYLVIGILSEYRGLGLGTKLFKQLQEWATKHSIHRLELSVVNRNEAGLKLYKKMGFDIEGTKRDSLYIDGEFVDEYYMSKLL